MRQSSTQGTWETNRRGESTMMRRQGNRTMQQQQWWTKLFLAVTALTIHNAAYGWTTQRLRHQMLNARRATTRLPMMRSSPSSERAPRVVIAGAGFGGLTCQNELQRQMPNSEITIVEPNERFTFLPLLYEYLGGFADLDEIAPTYDYLLSSPSLERGYRRKKPKSTVSIQRATALEVHPANKTLTIRQLSSGKEENLPYDDLIVSCGLPPSSPKPNRPSIPPTAFSFATLDDAVRLKRRLGVVTADKSAQASIVVVGGGYVGSELACTISKIVPKNTQVTILHRDPTQVCPGAESFNREEAKRRLESLGVNVELGATVTQVERSGALDEVQYTDANGNNQTIRADVLIWTVPGSTKKPREIVKGLPVDDRGRVVVAPTCQVQGMEHVYAIGDGAVISNSTSPYPATAQVAMQEANVVAYNIQANLEGQSPKTFSYQPLGEMLSLGGDEDAAISSLNGLFRLKGPLASTARRLVYAARMPSPQQAVRSGAGYVIGSLARGVNEAIDVANDAVENMSR